MIGRPGDYRGFVHKRLLGGIGGFFTGGPLGAIGGFLTGGRQPGETAEQRRARQRARTPVFPAPVTFRPTVPFRPPPPSPLAKPPTVPGRPFGLTPDVGRGDVCQVGFVWNGQACVPVNGGGAPQPIQPLPPGAVEGAAIVGRFGAGILPDTFEQRMTKCPRGMVLGVDVICYNRRDLRNSDRMWPRGRRPLLTGGDMRCISVAARAATKLKGKQKQLEELGLLKKPAPRRRPALAAGHHAHVAHDGA